MKAFNTAFNGKNTIASDTVKITDSIINDLTNNVNVISNRKFQNPEDQCIVLFGSDA